MPLCCRSLRIESPLSLRRQEDLNVGIHAGNGLNYQASNSYMFAGLVKTVYQPGVYGGVVQLVAQGMVVFLGHVKCTTLRKFDPCRFHRGIVDPLGH